MNTDKIKGEELFKKNEVKDTPFTIIEFENKFYVSIGTKYRLSEAFESKNEAITNAKSITWARIMQIINILKEETK